MLLVVQLQQRLGIETERSGTCFEVKGVPTALTKEFSKRRAEIEEALDEWHADGGRSDYEAVMEGYVSVTPLQADLTDHKAIGVLEMLLNPR